MKYFLGSNTGLEIIKNNFEKQLVVETPVVNNQIFIFDFSGSMYGEIERMGVDVCNKISEMSLNDKNTYTFIWFSSENQFGTIVEEYKIDTIQQLENLKQLIKKNFRTMGVTSFNNPLKVAYELAKKIKTRSNEESISLWFLSDGQHNDGSRSKVYEYCELLQSVVDSSLFVEYGNYCDRKMMSDMASYMSGELITSANFKSYQLVLERFLNKDIKSVKKVQVTIDKPLNQTAFVTYENSTAVVKIENNSININEDYKSVFSFVEMSDSANIAPTENILDLYKFASYLTQIGVKNQAKSIFKLLGDNYYYNKLNNAIGKPSIDLVCLELSDDINQNVTYKNGVSEIIENDKSFCFFDLLEVLNKTNALFYPYSDYGFNYKRITAERGDNGELNSVNQKREKELVELINNTKNIQDKQKLNEELQGLYSNSTSLKEVIKDDLSVGYSFNDLVWNKDVPNLSLRVKKNAVVDVNSLNIGINEIPTVAFRTYNIILNGGYYNVDVLPVKLTKVAYTTLNFHGVLKDPVEFNESVIYQVDLKKIPSINNSMIKNYQFKDFCELEYKKLVLQADAKVLKHYLKDAEKSDLLTENYPQHASLLNEKGFRGAAYGITYSPKNTSYLTERLDFIEFLSCNIKIKSYSSFGSVESVLTKIEGNKKLNGPDTLMKQFIDLYKDKNQDELKIRKRDVDKINSEVLNDLAKFKFIKLVGGENFTDVDNIYENPTHVYTFDNIDFTFTYEEETIKEKI